MTILGRTLGDVRETRLGRGEPLTLAPAIEGIRHTRPGAAASKEKEAARVSLRAFSSRYLRHHFSEPFCELHDDIFHLCDRSANGPARTRAARIAPRKFGKSTLISLAKPIHALAYQTHSFILLVGESAAAAEANLATITQELESNERLLRDFPHLAPARDRKNQLVKWTDRQMIVSSLGTIMAKGMGTRMLVIKYRQSRPDLAVVDDPESPETADTFLKRRRHKRWFGGTFLGLGASNWDIYVIGNLPHHDCLIADLVKDRRWDGRLWRAVNRAPDPNGERYPVGNTRTDGSPLWPEVWDLDRLEAYRREPNVGALGFSREMMNDPRSEEEKVFDPVNFTFIDWDESMLKSYAAVAMAIDPAGGEKPGDVRKGVRDWCCIGIGGRTRDGYIDVFDVVMTRQTPEYQVAAILDMYARWRPRRISVEENMYRNLYAPTIERVARERRLYPSIIPLTNTANKVARILGLQPQVHAVSGGRVTVRFARHLFEAIPEFFVQFDEFPTGHDDGPDMTEMLVRALEKGSMVGHPTGISSGPSYWRGAA